MLLLLAPTTVMTDKSIQELLDCELNEKESIVCLADFDVDSSDDDSSAEPNQGQLDQVHPSGSDS